MLHEKSEILLKEFENFLHTNLPNCKSFHPHFEKALHDILKLKGKRFRPLLLLSVVDIYEPLLVPNSLSVAMALEMIHTYSLIHDDLPTFDNASLRRSHPTLHVTYDEVTATLVGDALNTDSFLFIANAPLSNDTKIALIRELSSNAGSSGMVLGQAIDCFFENKKLTLDKLTFLHIHKTAKLIACSLKMGAIIVDLPKEKQELIYEIGLKIGLLFQVQDDIIDATKTTKEAGKPTSSDTNKNSFSNLLGVKGALKEKTKLIDEIKIITKKVDSKLEQRVSNMIDTYLK